MMHINAKLEQRRAQRRRLRECRRFSQLIDDLGLDQPTAAAELYAIERSSGR